MSGLLSLYDRASLSFKIFDRLLFSMREVSSPIRFTQDWKVGETRSELYEACSFVAKNRISSEAPDYLAEILIADASPDPSEPYIPDVEESTLEQVDNHLMTELSKEYAIESWGGSRLAKNKCGLKTLTSDYRQQNDGKIFQVLSIRLELVRPKLVLFAMVDIERAPQLMEPIRRSIRQIELLE